MPDVGADDIVILAAVRTPIGRFQGSLSATPAPELGACVIREAVHRAGVDPGEVTEVLMGNVVQAGIGQAPARQAALGAGLPDKVGATTINKVCGSGLKAVMLAAAGIRAGDGNIYVAGGMESMNQAPFLLSRARFGYRLGNAELVDAVVHDGLWCAFEHQHMGLAAEWVAGEYGVTRRDQDEYALESHRRAIDALDAKLFADEETPAPIHVRDARPPYLEEDETPRRETSLEALARLKPAFRPDGTVTAGNAPGITDGAAALIVSRRSEADAAGIRPMARVLGYSQASLPPLELFLAPILAMRKLADQLQVAPRDFDLVEVNEAFAAQAVVNIRELHLDPERVNVNGGSIALGHPIGASGARVLTTLLYALRHRGKERGAAVLCLGGGEAVALAVEMES